jgi:hypothetical protein
MKVIIDCSKKKLDLSFFKWMVWNLNVQLETTIATRCSANMSKVTCASMARNQRTMKKRRKRYKRILV